MFNLHLNQRKSNAIEFLDALVTRVGNKQMGTKVYRKETNTDIYINWNAYVPSNQKIRKLQDLLKPAKIVRSNETLLKK